LPGEARPSGGGANYSPPVSFAGFKSLIQEGKGLKGIGSGDKGKEGENGRGGRSVHRHF